MIRPSTRPSACVSSVPPFLLDMEKAGCSGNPTAARFVLLALEQHYRSENVKNAFVLRDGDCLANKHILLVDDVVTTGATSCACAHVLEQAHPAHISFACLAFVDDDR